MRGQPPVLHGLCQGAPSASYDIDLILTTTAAGVMTFVETDFAGFWYDARLTTDDEFWRTIASGGAKSAASAQVITDKEVKGATAYMNISPELSPVLSVEVNYRGDAEFYWNGERVRLIKDALDPETNYSPILVMQSESASAKKVGVDWFDACWWSYPGPVFP